MELMRCTNCGEIEDSYNNNWHNLNCKFQYGHGGGLGPEGRPLHLTPVGLSGGKPKDHGEMFKTSSVEGKG